MLRALLLSLALLSITGEAFALTVSWTCNPEPDMKEYRVESSKDAGKSWGVEAIWPHPKPCVSPVKMSITRYLAPGERLFRVFGIDTAGNVARQPSEPASYTVKPSPIGNPGGQEEAALPPSPYKATPTPPAPPPAPPPPPVIVPPPPAPVVVKPGAIPSMVASDIQPKSAVITVVIPEGAKVDVRFAKAPMSWGSAGHAICNEAGRCEILDLDPGTDYEYQGVLYFGVMKLGGV